MGRIHTGQNERFISGELQKNIGFNMGDACKHFSKKQKENKAKKKTFGETKWQLFLANNILNILAN